MWSTRKHLKFGVLPLYLSSYEKRKSITTKDTKEEKMSTRVFITEDPYRHLDEGKNWHQRGVWPCKWITCPEAGSPPFVAAYRRTFRLEKDCSVRAHLSGDERYELFLDGQRVGRGSERGDVENWFFETYDLTLSKGAHVLVARVWSLGAQSAWAQVSAYHGFLFSPQEEKFIHLLGTGVADWSAKKLGGYTFVDPTPAWGTGAKLRVDGEQFDWGFELGEGQGWEKAMAVHPGLDSQRAEMINPQNTQSVLPIHQLRPATLPAMLEARRAVRTVRFVGAVQPPPVLAEQPAGGQPARLYDGTPSTTPEAAQTPSVRLQDNLADEQAAWQAMLRRVAPLSIPPHTRRRVIIDLENYYCAYPELVLSAGKGSRVRLLWAESLFIGPAGQAKGERGALDGKYFIGTGDTFIADGGNQRRFDTLWWQAGRYLEVQVETQAQALILEQLTLRETRYPLEAESSFISPDARLEQITPILLRGLQMCAHETFVDCPYYEQLMYVGDTRLETLATYALSHDDRLPRKALDMFQATRLANGLTRSRCPSHVRQTIPPFSLWWVGMVHDFTLWRGDLQLVKGLMPAVRGVIDAFLGFMNPDGLVQGPTGWNFMDWVPGWPEGIPPDGDFGVSGLINWQMVWTLRLAGELENWLGEPELAARMQRLAHELAGCATQAFWDEERGLLADDLAHRHFSEHTQCLALLSGCLDDRYYARASQSLLYDLHLTPTTIYFTHYLFETYRQLGCIERLFERLGLWFDLLPYGFKTTPEMPEPTRSDCHGWGAHPLYHYYASLLGIRPAAPGFQRVRIAPQLGKLLWAQGRMVHPLGWVEVDFRVEDGTLRGRVELPLKVSGELVYQGKTQLLHEGEQEIRL